MTTYPILKGNLRLIVVWPVIGVLLCCSLWALTLLQLKAEKQAVEQHALDTATALSNAYARYLVRSIDQFEQTTLQLKYEWTQSGATLRLDTLKASGLYASTHYAMVAILDAHGRPRTSTAPFDSLDRAGDAATYLDAHARSDSGALRIGLGGAAQPLVHFTRRLENSNGQFDGVLVISVDAAYFADFYDGSHFGQSGLLAMIGRDARIYSARLGPAMPGANATPFTDTAFLATPGGAMLAPGARAFHDQKNRFLAWSPLAGYPMRAVIGLDESDMLLPYQQTRAVYLRVAAVVSALLLALTAIASVLSFRLALRHQQSEDVRSAYRMATEGTNDGFYIVTARRDAHGAIVDFEFTDCNAPGAAYFGQQREELLGTTVLARASEAYFQDLFLRYQEAMASGFLEQEVELSAHNPLNLRWIRRRLVRSGERLAVTLQDISEAKSHEQELVRLANEDGLTGLPNRHWLGHYMPGAIERAGGAMLALLFIDLDGFKDINDAKGHAEGDDVLRVVARRLTAAVRPSDRVVRLGGDEFVILLDPVESEASVERVALRIASAFEEPFHVNGGRHIMSSSVGISLYPRDGTDTEMLLKNADIAMYSVKMAGKGHHRFYLPELYEVIRRRSDTEQNLLAALEHDQFIVHYQPRADTDTGELCSMEALVRWLHPSQGTVPPLDFISIAEGCGLIAQLGELVIEKVCRQLALWQAQGLELVPVSINVSAYQFGRGDMPQVLAAAMARHRIDARLIEVEITESAMMGEQSEVLAQMAAIRAQGIKLLVDDFGTGYSSLSQLQLFAMDGLKIDRAFTTELGRSEQGEIFVGAIVSMAHALGMSVVAEGVETAQQLAILRALSCNEVQGYLISRPVMPERMAELMKKRFLIEAPALLPAWPDT